MGRGLGWCKGLTKETDSGVALIAKKAKERASQPGWCPNFTFEGRHHTELNKSRMTGRPSVNCPYSTKEQLYKLYWDEKLSIAEIEEKLNARDLSYWFDKYAIPMRTFREAARISASKPSRIEKLKQSLRQGDRSRFVSDINRRGASKRAKNPNSAFRLASKRTQFKKGEPHPWSEIHRTNHKKAVSSPTSRQKKSRSHKELFKDKEFRERMLKQLLQGLCKRPTKPEIQLESIINKACPNCYEYTGNGKIIIDGLCPDFCNTNGKKKLIEMFGDYWHSEKVTGRTKSEEEEQRIHTFSKYGYNTLIIWECELTKSEEELIKIVKEFNESI